jgi:hypothetical protein
MSLSDYEKKVTEFLIRPENLPAALEVADHILEVKRLLVLEFWRAVADRVRGSIVQFPAWVMRLDTDDKLFRGTGEPGITLQPKVSNSDPGFFAFKLGDGANSGVFYGIFCDGRRSSELRSIAENLPEFRAVQEKIETFPTQGWGGWLIGRFLDELTNHKGLRENENIIRMSQGGALADRASEVFIDLFQTNAAEIESINVALATLAGI